VRRDEGDIGQHGLRLLGEMNQVVAARAVAVEQDDESGGGPGPNVVEAGPDNAIRVETDPATGEPRPYLHVRRGLEALIHRPVFYELVEMAQERDGVMQVSSNGAWFTVGPVA
jgi:hypothetical protein